MGDRVPDSALSDVVKAAREMTDDLPNGEGVWVRDPESGEWVRVPRAAWPPEVELR